MPPETAVETSGSARPAPPLGGPLSAGAVPDLLRAVMFSGNTALVWLRSDGIEARLGFAGGELVRVARSDTPLSRDELLEQNELDPETEPDAVAECIREQALWTILDLFDWDDGEFLIDTLAQLDSDWTAPAGLCVAPPIPRDAFDLEITRRLDERNHAADLKARFEAEPKAEPELEFGMRTALGEREHTPLVGDFRDRAVPELLRTMMHSGNTGCLRFKRDEEQARLGFVNGELVRFGRSDPSFAAQSDPPPDDDSAAEYLRDQALWSVLELFDWEGGSFELEPMADPTEAWDGFESLTMRPPVPRGVLDGEILRRMQPEPATDSRARDETVLTGRFTRDSVADLLHTVMFSGNSALLRLRCQDLDGPDAEARLAFANGELVRVVHGERKRTDEGAERERAFAALAELFEWQRGEFELDPLIDTDLGEDASAGLRFNPPLNGEALDDEIGRRLAERAPIQPIEPEPSTAAGPPAETRPAILVSPDLEALENLKSCLDESLHPIHSMQIPEQAIRRVGHYLTRRIQPLLILDATAPHWPAKLGWAEVAERVHAMSKRVPVAALTDGEIAPSLGLAATLHRPLSQENAAAALASLAKNYPIAMK